MTYLWIAGWVLTLFLIERRANYAGFTWFGAPLLLAIWPIAFALYLIVSIGDIYESRQLLKLKKNLFA